MDPRIERVARIAHEVNRAYCAALGDVSQLPWEDAPEWQRISAINGVQFHIGHPGAAPCDSHNNWMAEKVEAGWTFGPVKDEAKKEHPCLVPYELLALEQRVKDSLFISVVSSMRAELPASNYLAPAALSESSS